MSECVIDTERIRKDLGDRTFEALEAKLRSQWDAQCFFFKQKLARIKAASDRIERCAEQQTGFRNTVMLDAFGFACLERYHQGWQQDAKSFEKDLAKWHPECVVKVGKRTNFSGWSRSLGEARESPNPKSQGPKKEGIQLTDNRGNAT